jgi:hypothetical protein
VRPAAWAISLPTSVEPVNPPVDVLVLAKAAPVAITRDDIEHAADAWA